MPTYSPDLAHRIYQRSRLTGSFVLRSGTTSREYFDKYLFESDPSLLREIAQALVLLMPEDVDVLAGLELGGVPLAAVCSQMSGLPTLFVRKQAKGYGTCRFAEGGPVAGKRLVVIEDVITSGGQVINSCRQLRAEGAEIATVLCVIDREAGGTENLAAEDLQLCSLFTMSELQDAASSDALRSATTRPGRQQIVTHVGIHPVDADWTIRPAGEHDVEQVLSLWDAAGSAETVTDTREGVLGLLDVDPEALLVAEVDGGEIVGSLIAAWDGWRGGFYRLAVYPDRRRQGLATALLRAGERRLLARGAARFTAIITDDDPDAMGFWTTTGYEQQENRARFVRNVAPLRVGP
jgi:orotate phosphoribosyltransferase